jgi:hypothetical protein
VPLIIRELSGGLRSAPTTGYYLSALQAEIALRSERSTETADLVRASFKVKGAEGAK